MSTSQQSSHLGAAPSNTSAVHVPAITQDRTATTTARARQPTPTSIVSETTPEPFDPKPSNLGPSHPDSFNPEPDRSPPSPSRCVSPIQPPSQVESWPPSHNPSWSLGRQHPTYVHAAAGYLVGVPGGPEWEKLLADYITFESLSASVPVSRLHSSLSALSTNDLIGLLPPTVKPAPRSNRSLVQGWPSILSFERHSIHRVHQSL